MMPIRLSLRPLAGVLLATMLISPALVSPVMAQGGFFGSSSRSDGESAVRLNRVEEQMRALNGQIEELNHQIRQLQDQLRRAQEDADFRFQELEGSGTPGKRSQAPQPATTGNAVAANSVAVATPQRGNPPQTLGTIPSQSEIGQAGDVPAASGRPLDLSALATRSAGQAQPQAQDNGLPGVGSDGALPAGTDDAIGQLVLAPTTGIARDDYDRAYNQVLGGDYALAGQSFRQFLADYPEAPLASNAQYWLGESFYSRGLYRDSADAFLKTYTDYPETSKAPDSLLKLGLSLGSLGQGDAACATYSELLSKYPGAAAAVLNRARAEQKSAGCS